ncbi:hypothetical protein ABZX62_33655 [Streptomyces flavidovirens]|uniref:Uncharacterized protein n=1 Tax=Streptomyces flavidovirens TaxID=67298 RepID=A0ABW6RFM1_9ACTN
MTALWCGVRFGYSALSVTPRGRLLRHYLSENLRRFLWWLSFPLQTIADIYRRDEGAKFGTSATIKLIPSALLHDEYRTGFRASVPAEADQFSDQAAQFECPLCRKLTGDTEPGE